MLRKGQIVAVEFLDHAEDTSDVIPFVVYGELSVVGRKAQPQIGGLVIRSGDEDVYTRPFVKSLKRPAEVQL